jgi:hypothetical protein
MHATFAPRCTQVRWYLTHSCLMQRVTLKFVWQQAFSGAMAHKNPKVLQEVGVWAAKSVGEFGADRMDRAACISQVKSLLTHANTGVRQAGVDLAGMLYQAWGDSLIESLATDLKPATMATVRERCGRERVGTLPDPVRFEVSPSTTSMAQPLSDAGLIAAVPAEAPTDACDALDALSDVSERVDISPLITQKLLAQMGSAKWQERSAALAQVETILREAGGCIGPATGELFPSLKLRFLDTNRNVAAHAMQLCVQLVKAMGPSFSHAGRSILIPVLIHASDSKTYVREAVSDFVEAFVSRCGWHGLKDALITVLPSVKCTGIGKSAILGRFLALVQSPSRSPRTPADFAVLVRASAIALGDKSIVPRQQATALVAALSVLPNGDAMLQAAAAHLSTEEQRLIYGVLNKADLQSTPAPTSSKASAPRPATARALGRIATAPPAAGRLPAVAPLSSRTAHSALDSAASLSSSISCKSAAMRPGSARPGSANAAAAVDEGLPLLPAGSDASDKEKRALPPRSRKFEVRPTEAMDVQRLLAPYTAPYLLPQMFARDFSYHCLAAEKLMVRSALV